MQLALQEGMDEAALAAGNSCSWQLQVGTKPLRAHLQLSATNLVADAVIICVKQAPT